MKDGLQLQTSFLTYCNVFDISISTIVDIFVHLSVLLLDPTCLSDLPTPHPTKTGFIATSEGSSIGVAGFFPKHL